MDFFFYSQQYCIMGTHTFERYHNLSLPDSSLVSEVTHAVIAFATPETFLDSANTSTWQPFEAVDSVKRRFSPNTKVCLSIGGWGSNVGFEKGSLPANQASYASNVASVVQRLNFDCVGMQLSRAISWPAIYTARLYSHNLVYDRHRLGIPRWGRR